MRTSLIWVLSLMIYILFYRILLNWFSNLFKYCSINCCLWKYLKFRSSRLIFMSLVVILNRNFNWGSFKARFPWSFFFYELTTVSYYFITIGFYWDINKLFLNYTSLTEVYYFYNMLLVWMTLPSISFKRSINLLCLPPYLF